MLSLDMQSRQPIYEQLITKMTEMIVLGDYAPAEQLPSVRMMARDLGVNPNTVQKAYQELERKGVIYSVAGKGSFITPGDSAAEMLRGQNISQLRSAVCEGKRAGLTLTQTRQVVDEVYMEEENQ